MQLARSEPTSYLCLFRHLKRIIDLVAEIAHGVFQLRMSQQKLHAAQIACSPKCVAFVRRIVCVPYSRGSRPMLLTHDLTTRAYCRVDRCGEIDIRLGNK